jgi:hypothetical protein
MKPQKIAARVGRVNLRDTEINCIRIGGRGGLATVQRPSWGRLWPRRSRRSCSRYSPQGRLPTTTSGKRHVVLVVEIAFAIAIPRPPRVFAQRGFRLHVLHPGDERENTAVEVLVGDRKRGIAADQEASGGVGRETIVVRIFQDRDP